MTSTPMRATSYASLEYDDIEMLEDDEACLKVKKGEDWGYLDSTGHFHREDDVDILLTYL